MKKAKSGAKNSALFLYKNPLPRMIADMGGDKKSATTNDSGYGCRGTLSYFITA